MASLTLRLDERCAPNGRCQVRVRISHNHTSAFVPTGVYLTKGEFVPDLYRPMRNNNRPDAVEQIKAVVRKLDEVIFTLRKSGELQSITATQIKEQCFGKKAQAAAVISKDEFCLFYKEFAEARRTENTRQSYLYSLRVLREYCESVHKKGLRFADVDYAFIDGYRNYMQRSGRGERTVYLMLSYLRAVCNDARKRKKEGMQPYVFEDITMHKPEAGEIEYLHEDQFRQFLSYDLSHVAGSETLERARDIMLISFYMCGANFLDIYNMPKQSGNEIVFVRSKLSGRTNKPVHIFVEPELKVLLEKYKGNKGLFSFADGNGEYKTFQRNLNHRFARLSQLLGFTVNLAIVRRTWATYAGKLEVSEFVIDKSIGHKVNSVTSSHYENYDWGRTQRANRQVIDYAHARK